MMEPAQVVYCGPCRGSGLPSHIDLITLSGEEICVKFGGVLKPVPVSGVKWPDVQLSTGSAKYLMPRTCKIVKLGRMTTLEESPVTINRKVETYMRDGGSMSEVEGKPIERLVEAWRKCPKGWTPAAWCWRLRYLADQSEALAPRDAASARAAADKLEAITEGPER